MTKQDILEAALGLACEKGLGSLSMSQIAERVHLKKSSLYSHFASKDEIIESMYDHFRKKAKQQQGIPDIDYGKLFEGCSLKAVLTAAVDQYRKITENSDLNQFYRLIMAERVHDPSAAVIMVEETRKMIAATRQLFYALSAKKIVSFEDPDAAALCFAMGIHSILDFENDAAGAGTADADGAMKRYIDEFCRIYEQGQKKEPDESRIFQKENWHRWKNGLSNPDRIRRLDPEKDCMLLAFSMEGLNDHRRQLLMRRMGIANLPGLPVNIDDKDDGYYAPYLLLRERVYREEDRDVLERAAYCAPDYQMRCFAFCRLTGYAWVPPECDAYSYRTYRCGLLRSMSREDILCFCHGMIESDGPFAGEAGEWLEKLFFMSDAELEELKKQ